ncbi:MAG: right-handed parallel beta-helix repeat-containing protein [Bacteroidota bacterium]
MKLFLFLSIAILQYTFAGYSTPNTGVKWTMDSLVQNSGGVVTGVFPVYTVNDTVFVSATDLLSIRKGSTVKITYRKGITVRGGFLAIGTKDSLIRFTQSDSMWQELRFEDTAIDSLCRMEYIVVEYARLGLDFINASPTVIYSTIKNTGAVSGTLAGSGNYGIQCFASDAVLKNDSIYNNAQYGININSGSSPMIENCIIFNNNLQGTAFKNQISIGAQGMNSPVIRHCEIYHTVPNIKVGAISISAFFAGSGSNALIENNHLHHNAYGIAIASQGTSTLNVMVRNNRIAFNTYSDQNAAGSGMNFNSVAPAVQNTIVTGNQFSNNLWGITVLGNARPNLGDITNADTSDNGMNVFLNNKNRDTVFALYNNSAFPLKAQNNFWGYSDPDSVARVIVDSSDIVSLGKVTYFPFLKNSPVLSVKHTSLSPEHFILDQNYPNPFNPTTVIRFTLPTAEYTTLTVYDALGRESVVLHRGTLSSGTHEFRFNGAMHSSGIYLYQLRSGGMNITRKMLLMK